MRTPLCDEFGIEHPIFAFTPSEHVAAAVSRAGGLGVLGCVRFNDTDELERTLSWLDDNTDGKPYGVDVVMPMKIPTEGTSVDLQAMIPPEHLSFVERTLQQLGVPPLPEGEGRDGVLGWLHSVARSHVDVALAHRPVLIANALGSPPVDVIEKAHEHGVKVAALAGAAKHALSHVANGVDVIVAQGYEAGGHTGEIASMVLTPEIVDAVGPDVPVLGAGGIGSGRQIAASLALGAQGVWTGSIWLTVEEYDLSSGVGIRDGLLRAQASTGQPIILGYLIAGAIIGPTICPTGIETVSGSSPRFIRLWASATRRFCSGIGSGDGAPSSAQASVHFVLSRRAGLPV